MLTDDGYPPDEFVADLAAWADAADSDGAEPADLIEMCRRAAGQYTADAVASPRRAHSGFAGQIAAFEARLEARWGDALDLADLVVDQAFGSGSWANELLGSLRASGHGERDEALVKLHCKAVMTAREVMVLLRSGYSSGAMARWRTLHEVWVVFLVLIDGDEELSRRYLAHEDVEGLKGQQEYEQTWEAIGLEPPDWAPEERDEIRAQLKDEFGAVFLRDYGWAAELFDGKAPKFNQLQAHVRLDHWRGYYRMASHGTHATPKGTTWNIQSLTPIDVAWAGPSNSGLVDPAQCTLIGLAAITGALLAHVVGEAAESDNGEFADLISAVVRQQSILMLMDHAIDELGEVHAQQEAEESDISDLIDRALMALQAETPMTAYDLADELDVDLQDLEDALAAAAERGQLRHETLYRTEATGSANQPSRR